MFGNSKITLESLEKIIIRQSAVHTFNNIHMFNRKQVSPASRYFSKNDIFQSIKLEKEDVVLLSMRQPSKTCKLQTFIGCPKAFDNGHISAL